MDSWKAKLISLLLAMLVWYLIRTHLQSDIPFQFPIPGEVPAKGGAPAADEPSFGPFGPPVPGGGKGS